MKRSDLLEVGERYESLVVHVKPELNKQFVKALDASSPRYGEIVHPGLFINFSSITQSPSFYLEKDVAAVGAKFEANFINPGKVDGTFRFSWAVSEVYERRSRKYQICDVSVKDNSGLEIMRRRINNTFIGGEYLERRIKWEKETGYRRAVQTSDFPQQGYEIVGTPRALTMEKQRWFSGGLPGPKWPARNIHTDREISIRSGIGRPIASGLMFEAYLGELMIDFFGEHWLTHGEAKVIAVDMAGEGDIVVPKAVIDSWKPQKRASEVSLNIWCENQYKNKVMVGTARCLNGITAPK